MIMYGQWLRLSINTRHTIAQKFGIAKTLPTHVQGGDIIADGYKIHDVENALTSERMREYLGVDHADVATLFALLVQKIENPEQAPEPVVEPVVEVSPEKVETPVEKPKKRTKKPKSK